MNVKGKTKMTASALMRLAGVSAMVAGVCFLVVGFFHPVNVPASVNTTWVIVHIFATALGFFGLFGMAGLYARQVEGSGWLGLAGFLMFTGWMTVVCGASFVEAFILPSLTTESPAFIASWMGMFSGVRGAIDLGTLPMIWNLSNLMFVLGPLLFGIATWRARILPRAAAVLMALNTVLVPLGALVPPAFQPKLIMIPMGIALAWLGYALFAERREKVVEPVLDHRAFKAEAGKAA